MGNSGPQSSQRIIIRGNTSLGGNNQPIFVIDGIIIDNEVTKTGAGQDWGNDLKNLNADDFESMSVLKDAASASIYGSRAANGVILITTKQGKSGTLKLEYNGYVSFESIRKTLTPVSNYADYMELVNEGYTNSNLATKFSQTSIDAWRNDAGKNPLLYPNTDWIDETFQSSVANNHVLSMNGGSEKIRFYSSFGFSDNPGVVENAGSRNITDV